ncbi:hypothetical protein [Streptomyces sp. NPDC020298]|uniref:hypothetical protein n=1 Tax=unclassified Streptomyces TaxID=2593676 RepID=UPI0033C35D49
MNRYRVATFATALLLLSCAACGDDKPPRGADALKKACGGILDSAEIKEAQKSDSFDRLYDASASGESHASAAKTLLDDDHAAYACRIAIADAPASGDGGLSIKFTPGLDNLFPEQENHSYSSYKAYKLGSGMQATTESGSADLYFPCRLKGQETPISVTGSLYNSLDLSVEIRFRILFRSTLKMVSLLKCENGIKFPAPETMQPLPLKKS